MLGLFCDSGVRTDDSSCCWSEFLGRLKMYSVVSVMKLVDSFTNVCEMTFVSYRMLIFEVMGFPGGSDSKECACNAGDLGSIPRLGRSPGGGHGNPLYYSCLENTHGFRGTW